MAEPRPSYSKHDLDRCIETTQDINAEEYKMNHKHRGIALILAHSVFSGDLPELSETKNDVEALKNVLKLLGFETIVKENLTKIEIRLSCKIVRERTEILKNCDCFAVFILSYKLNDNTFMAFDDSYNLYELAEQYSSGAFKELALKPKLFFISTKKLSQNIQSESNIIGTDVKETVQSYPVHADFLFSKSSHHKQSANGNAFGSWYIQDLCQSINYFHANSLLSICGITDILRYSQNLTSSRELFNGDVRQTPNYISSLCRKLYFKPQI